jgi:hypothetical protein
MYDLVQVNYCMCVPHYQILKRNGAIINAEVNNAILIYDLDGIIIRSCSLSSSLEWEHVLKLFIKVLHYQILKLIIESVYAQLGYFYLSLEWEHVLV